MIDEKELIKILVDYKSDKWNRELYTSLLSVVDDCIDFVESQPKIGEWIPCSERLPEDGKDVLVWIEYFRYDNYNRLFQTYGIGYTHKGEWCGWRNSNIIAWQPLPEPYQIKGGKEPSNE